MYCEACSVTSPTHSLPLDLVRQAKINAEDFKDATITQDGDAGTRKIEDARLAQVLLRAKQKTEELPNEVIHC